jgi:serine phosphatase RsbU (regulator of sigma subunit)
MARGTLWWLLGALAADTLIMGIDLAIGHGTANMVGLFLIGPLLIGQRLAVGPTAAVVAYAVALGVLSGAVHQTLGTTDFAIRFTVLLLGSVYVLYSTRQRAAWTQTLIQAAEVAQQAILRPVGPRIGAVSIAVSYRSATTHTLVGGDLYDVTNTVFGVRILIGDVRGKGLEAVRLAAATIGFFRDLAYIEADMARLVRRLDASMAPHLGEEDFITLVVAEFVPGEMRMVNCGHHPPLHITDKLTKFLAPPEPSPPVGLWPTPRLQHVPLGAGDRLLFYTDGLVEARNDRGDFFEIDGELETDLATRPLPEALRCVEERLAQHAAVAHQDDVALVLLAPQGAAAGAV